MKKLILVFLFIIPLVSSLTELKENVKLNEAITVNGKSMKILSVNSAHDLRVEVDGIEGIIPNNKERTINDMQIKVINLIYFDKDNILATLSINVRYECGDSSCNSTETSESCCTDCGCPNNLICSNNICQKSQCEFNKDCNDNNTCTTDKCEGTLKKCTNQLIESCNDNDKCCPSSCNFQDDNDCLPPLDNCNKTEECNDNNICTLDECTGIPKNCNNTIIGYCILNEECYKENAIKNKKYCTIEGWKEQKKKYQPCINTYECLNNDCKEGYCGGIQKRKTAIIMASLIIFLIIITGIYIKTLLKES